MPYFIFAFRTPGNVGLGADCGKFVVAAVYVEKPGQPSLAAAGVLRLRKPLGLAVGVGATVGLGCYLAGPPAAAAVSGLAGFVASLAASALRIVQGNLARGASPHP